MLRANTYRIERVLGQGGFGITYLATDVTLEREVAIKEFFPKDYCARDQRNGHVLVSNPSNAKFVEQLKVKFLKEARNIVKFDNPYIIKIHAAFEENNTAYYVMDYIEGMTISEMVKQNGPMPMRQATEYMAKIGSALSYLHNSHINHLDVKPANILVRRKDNTPILIDFGLSKQYDKEGQQMSMFLGGVSHGYTPPEQYNNEGLKNFSPQSDLYSLAATYYYMLSGVVPPTSTSLLEDELTFPATIPAELISDISTAMSPARKYRHETVRQFVENVLKIERQVGMNYMGQSSPTGPTGQTGPTGPVAPPPFTPKQDEPIVVEVDPDPEPPQPQPALQPQPEKKKEKKAPKPPVEQKVKEEEKPESNTVEAAVYQSPEDKKVEVEEKDIRDSQEELKKIREEKARKKAEEKARREAEEKARREAEEIARREAEEKALAEQEAASEAVAETGEYYPDGSELDDAQRSNGKMMKLLVGIGTAVAVCLVIILFKVFSGSSKEETVAPTFPGYVENYAVSIFGTNDGLYTGDVDSIGRPTGHGTVRIGMQPGDTVVYVGNFVDGKLDGDAEYTFADGSKFVGTFKDNHYSEGKFTDSSGVYFEGKYDENGDPQKGTWHYTDGSSQKIP